MDPVLEIEDLKVGFPTRHGWLRAVDGVSLRVLPGETLGVVGESGCGKSMTALSVMGLVPRSGQVQAKALRVSDRDVTAWPSSRLHRIRGSDVGMIFQEPLTALHPAIPVGYQVAEAIRAHHPEVPRRQAWKDAVDLLDEVGIPHPGSRARDYPHTWSGGMRQRGMIAIALANRPRLLIADEPTTALDVTIQAQILALLRRLSDNTDMAMMVITHDLGVIAETADRVLVMYAGRVVEEAGVEEIFSRPQHPYTQGLLRSLPRLETAQSRLGSIPGRPPSVIGNRIGCSFAPRCPMADDRCCQQTPPLAIASGASSSACFHSGATAFPPGITATSTTPLRKGGEERSPLLEVAGLSVHYPTRSEHIFGRRKRLRAVDGIALSVRDGETLAIVGESGCGKTTAARAILRLLEPEAGTIRFRGRDVTGLSRGELGWFRRQVQAVFQDPHGSLNPRRNVFDIVASPLRVNGEWDATGRQRVYEALEMVGLGGTHSDQRPSELSGGQRQRVGIARALVLRPSLLVLDEPLSALDVSIQAQILNLLADLRDRMDLAYILIAHDLAVVSHLADRVAVMYLGRIVEEGSGEDVFTRPAHPYTRALLAAVPVPDPTLRHRPRPLLAGDVPSPTEPPSGCRFRSRCPIAQDSCARSEPSLEEGEHRWACFFPHDEALTG